MIKKSVNVMTEEDALDEKETESKEEKEEEETKPKYEFIEDLPGVGPATATTQWNHWLWRHHVSLTLWG